MALLQKYSNLYTEASVLDRHGVVVFTAARELGRNTWVGNFHANV